MTARDNVGALLVGEHDEAFGAAHAEDVLFAGGDALGIFRRDGGGEHHQSGAFDVRRGVAFEIAHAGGNIIGRGGGGHEIGAGELMSLREQETREAAHAAAADANEMDLLRPALQQLLEVLFYFRLHDNSISSATRLAASTPARLRAAAAIFSRSGLSFQNFRHDLVQFLRRGLALDQDFSRARVLKNPRVEGLVIIGRRRVGHEHRRQGRSDSAP